MNNKLLQPLLYGNQASSLATIDPPTSLYTHTILGNAGVSILYGATDLIPHGKQSRENQNDTHQLGDLDSIEYSVEEAEAICASITNAYVNVTTKNKRKKKMYDHDNRPTIKIMIMNKVHKALIDTGATHSSLMRILSVNTK